MLHRFKLQIILLCLINLNVFVRTQTTTIPTETQTTMTTDLSSSTIEAITTDNSDTSSSSLSSLLSVSSSSSASSSSESSSTPVTSTERLITKEDDDDEITANNNSASLETSSAGSDVSINGGGSDGKEEMVNDDSSVSFGIKSFTVEVSTTSQRNNNVNNLDGQGTSSSDYVSSTTTPMKPGEDNGANNDNENDEIFSTSSPSTLTTPSSGSSISTSPASSATTENPQSSSSLPSSSSPSTTVKLNTENTQQDFNYDINDGSKDKHKELKNKNGLFRIKIAEIITDEFDNGDAEADGDADSGAVDSQNEKSLKNKPIKLDTIKPILNKKEKKIDIVDFYPSKMEDFKPVIQESNDKILKTKSKLMNTLNDDELNMIGGNSLSSSSAGSNAVNTNEWKTYLEKHKRINGMKTTTKLEIDLVDNNNAEFFIRKKKSKNDNNEYAKTLFKTINDDEEDKSIFSLVKAQFTTTTPNPIESMFKSAKSIFDQVRVKKSDPFLKHNTGGSGIPYVPHKVYNATAVLHKVDFANTKFRAAEGHPTNKTEEKPEFSTTKFYNSKEISNEMHNMAMNKSLIKLKENKLVNIPKKFNAKSEVPVAVVLAKPKLINQNEKPEKMVATLNKHDLIELNFVNRTKTNSGTSKHNKQFLKTNLVRDHIVGITHGPSSFTTTTRTTASSASSSAASSLSTSPSATTAGIKSTSTAHLSSATTLRMTGPTTTSASIPSTASDEVSKLTEKMNLSVEGNPFNTNKQKNTRGHNISRLQEKINSLDCDIQIMTPELTIWRGNETHELTLPVTTPENCTNGSDCSPMIISWEGIKEIQSGDVLLVEIDDKQLIPSNLNESELEKTHHTTAAVYQVTRLGHEHCDITEGVLLDITPLVVDGKKLVTLYDKDLTEGVNLLIVVSPFWKNQCVRLKVTVKSDNCGETADCSGKGVCYSNKSMEGYECQCCSGFAGSHCEEIDACTPSPCTNNGICVDLSQGHEGNAYQCLCPYGYTGKNCQFESDPCTPSQCRNGGTCVGNSTHFKCECPSGYTGPLCQHNLNECDSSPCVHGICVDQEDGFRCFCQPGYSGDLCSFEYNECESNPCINGGQCIDNIGSYQCNCTRGYTGSRCHIKVDFCANDPCSDGHRCIDLGDDFTCECPGGRNGPDCNQVPRTLCEVNPCNNGGTCWTSEESFYCACRPGFTGKMCQDNYVNENVISSEELLSDAASSGLGSYEESHYKQKSFELHNAYIAAGTLTSAFIIVAIVVTACHCKVHQTYRHFSLKNQQFIPFFGRKNKTANTRHWLSGKNQKTETDNSGAYQNNINYNGTNINGINSSNNNNNSIANATNRIMNRPLALNLENDMYYTVDFSDSQNSPLIQ